MTPDSPGAIDPITGPVGADIEAALGDRYALLGRIGMGGMADVYLASDVRHGRKVAIKVMRRESVGKEGRQRFAREIAVVAGLSHPNIIPLFDSGQSDGVVFFVMPFVEGPTLRQHLRANGPLTPERAIALTL